MKSDSDGNTIFIASDYVEGATLKEWLRGQPLPLLLGRKAVCQDRRMLLLHSAHEAKVVHRDLKPGNIMMDTSSEPHIMDFGLAKRDSGEFTMTMDDALLGTPAYMSPEQAAGKGHEADRRSGRVLAGCGLVRDADRHAAVPWGEADVDRADPGGDQPASPRS